jgi:GT2 family glycosyltransferase
MTASIAIVIPSLNQGSFLGEAIESLLAQTGVDLQSALADGGSTDRTAEILSPWRGKFNYFRLSPDNGQAAAINEGISRLESTDYVGWLNADDLLLFDGLKAMASFLDHHPEYIAVFGKALLIDERGRITGEYPTRPFNRKRFAVTCTICQPASLIRRQAWKEVGGLDESFQTCLDYDLWWRLSKIGQIGYLKQFVACSRDHSQSKTRRLRKKVNEEAVAVLRRHWGTVPRNWCMANILENLEPGRYSTHRTQRWEATKLYFRINKWKALLPQNWLLLGWK